MNRAIAAEHEYFKPYVVSCTADCPTPAIRAREKLGVRSAYRGEQTEGQ